MNLMIELISKYGVAVINILGMVVFLLIFINYSKLKAQRDKIEDTLEGKRMKPRINKRTYEIEREELDEKATPEVMRERWKEFNKVCSWYQVFSQLVPLFPLFGILGTVAGLMQQISAEGDLEAIIGSLDTALGTTLYGLIWAIALKMLVAFSSERVIYEAEAMLEGFDKEFNDAIVLNNISED